MSSYVLTDISNNILTIKLNREDVLNAFNLQLISELVSSLNEAESNDEVKVIVITGVGRAFSAGGDLKAMYDKSDMFAGSIPELKKLYQNGIQQIPLTLEKIKKPVIAMVNGPAVGAGCDLACMCDLRVMDDKTFFKESFINLSLVSGDGGSYFLSRLVGYGRAMDLLLTGRKVMADEAVSIGLVNYAYPRELLIKKTYELAERLSQLPLQALMWNKELLKDATHSNLTDHLQLAADYQSIIQRSTEHETLVKKFFQKS